MSSFPQIIKKAKGKMKLLWYFQRTYKNKIVLIIAGAVWINIKQYSGKKIERLMKTIKNWNNTDESITEIKEKPEKSAGV